MTEILLLHVLLSILVTVGLCALRVRRNRRPSFVAAVYSALLAPVMADLILMLSQGDSLTGWNRVWVSDLVLGFVSFAPASLIAGVAVVVLYRIRYVGAEDRPKPEASGVGFLKRFRFTLITASVCGLFHLIAVAVPCLAAGGVGEDVFWRTMLFDAPLFILAEAVDLDSTLRTPHFFEMFVTVFGTLMYAATGAAVGYGLDRVFRRHGRHVAQPATPADAGERSA